MIEPPATLRFAEFELDRANRVLRRAGEPVALGSRYFDALVLLVDDCGALVTKDRFMDEVWRGIPVTDEALTQCIRTLRRALGDDFATPRFIETVPKHGYRFVADIAHSSAVSSARSLRYDGLLAGTTTLGGAAAGAIGGLGYALVGSAAGGGASLIVLTLLGMMLGLLGGAGVGLGLASATVLAPGKPWALILGGAAGGMAIGGLGAMLGQEGLALLFGYAPAHVTGLFEGLVLGAAVGLAVVAWNALRDMRGILAGIAVGAMAGAAIGLAGGRLLGGSLVELERRFPSSGLALEQMVTGAGWALPAFEAALFVVAVLAARHLAERK